MKNYFSPEPTTISIITKVLGSTVLQRVCTLTFSKYNVCSFVAVVESKRNVFLTETDYEAVYIISLIDRFNHSNTTLTASQCLKYCNDKNAYVIGADKVLSLTEFEGYLNKSFGYGEQGQHARESFTDPQRKRKIRNKEFRFHVNAFYDFTLTKWLNQVTLSEFDDSLWARNYNTYPLFPIVNDILGIVLKNTDK